MFEVVYAKGVRKDLKRIASYNLPQIKVGIEDLMDFPNIAQIKRLKNHPVSDYRLRVGNYRVLFDVNWEAKEILILKVGHRREVY